MTCSREVRKILPSDSPLDLVPRWRLRELCALLSDVLVAFDVPWIPCKIKPNRESGPH